ncbi:MAG: hypothetical protein JXJ22_17460 [Bacteroidales bacterium]|nr:hypothetical protein [Bacteroidales bacterium]
MIKKNSIILIFLLSTFVISNVDAQNYLNSPFSRFGIGNIIENGFVQNRAMGGISIGIRTSNYLNPLNPASYSAQDTLSFIFNAGILGQFNKFESGTEYATSKNINMNHISIGFPITKWWKTSIGIAPFSRMGYSFSQVVALDGLDETINIGYKGSGGINDFYIGNSVDLFHHISVGFNISYLFGSLNQERQVLIPEDIFTASARFNEKFVAGGILFRGGIQVYNTFNEKHTLILGFTYDNQSNIGRERELSVIRSSSFSADTLSYTDQSGTDVKIPQRYGFGFSYEFNEQLLLGADYVIQDWTKGLIFGTNDNLNKSNSLHFGLEYTLVPISQRIRATYWKYIHYRMGGHITNSYIKINGEDMTDSGMSFGIGLPWRNTNKLFTKTTFNVSYELGQRSLSTNNSVKEKYHYFSVGITLYDFWFIKSKYD